MRPTNTIATVLAAILALLVAGCGGGDGEQQGGGGTAGGQTTVEQTGGSTVDEERQAAGGEETERTTGGPGDGREVALEIGGDPGTAFSGTCTVGGEEEALEGEVPATFAYDPAGGGLECEIRNGPGGGALTVLLTGPGNRVEQRTDAPGGTISIALAAGGGVSSSATSSSSGGGSVNQVVSQSGSGG